MIIAHSVQLLNGKRSEILRLLNGESLRKLNDDVHDLQLFAELSRP